MFKPSHLYVEYLATTDIIHEFSKAVYYNGMPKELHMHSGQRAYLMSDDVQYLWISHNQDAYLFGLKVVVDDKWPKAATIDSIVQQSANEDR